MEQLYDTREQRKYLAQHERDRFMEGARSAGTPVRAFLETLAYTGCRLSEALALTPQRVDSAALKTGVLAGRSRIDVANNRCHSHNARVLLRSLVETSV